MDYLQAKEFIDKIIKESGIIFGLEAVRELLRRVGNPHEGLKVIHIAGTNAKGSVGTFLTSILDAAGYKTGRFFSPALFDYREVFQVSYRGNIECISREQVAGYMTLLAGLREDMIRDGFRPVSAFEIETVMALMYLSEAGCDVCVIECGMGGQNDATNVIDSKIMEIITPVSYDHTAVLGENLYDIAWEKSGIIREASVVVTPLQEDAVMKAICKRCDELRARLVLAEKKDIDLIENSIHGIMYNDNKHGIKGLRLAMLGNYQIQNAHVAVTSAIELGKMGFKIARRDIKEGLLRAHWKARFDIISSKPLVIADGAHNPHAAKELKASVDSYLKDYEKIYIMGVFKDKEYEKILRIMSDKDGEFYAVSTDNPRSLSSGKLCLLAEGLFKNTYDMNDIGKALDKALKDNCGKAVICFGSLSIMSEIYGYFDNLYENSKAGRIDRIVNNELFIENMRIIEDYECNRIFCGHDMSHLLDVARITWIMCMERGLDIKKDVVYAAALLHDIGRSAQYTSGVNHETAGAGIAAEILEGCGFSQEENKEILDAVRFHNSDNNDEGVSLTLRKLLRDADNMSRNCFMCKAASQCKWSIDKKNKHIQY